MSKFQNFYFQVERTAHIAKPATWSYNVFNLALTVRRDLSSRCAYKPYFSFIPRIFCQHLLSEKSEDEALWINTKKFLIRLA